MTDYEQLVDDLRHADDLTADHKLLGVCARAAAAIEELQAQLPKRGEWIRHPEVKNIYGGVYIECPLCGEKNVVQYVSDEKFCRNCGADMRAKMEVQE